MDHPGCALNSIPISIYGDEAVFSKTHSDKFIALVLESPLLHKAQRRWSAYSEPGAPVSCIWTLRTKLAKALLVLHREFCRRCWHMRSCSLVACSPSS